MNSFLCEFGMAAFALPLNSDVQKLEAPRLWAQCYFSMDWAHCVADAKSYTAISASVPLTDFVHHASMEARLLYTVIGSGLSDCCLCPFPHVCICKSTSPCDRATLFFLTALFRIVIQWYNVLIGKNGRPLSYCATPVFTFFVWKPPLNACRLFLVLSWNGCQTVGSVRCFCWYSISLGTDEANGLWTVLLSSFVLAQCQVKAHQPRASVAVALVFQFVVFQVSVTTCRSWRQAGWSKSFRRTMVGSNSLGQLHRGWNTESCWTMLNWCNLMQFMSLRFQGWKFALWFMATQCQDYGINCDIWRSVLWRACVGTVGHGLNVKVNWLRNFDKAWPDLVRKRMETVNDHVIKNDVCNTCSQNSTRSATYFFEGHGGHGGQGGTDFVSRSMGDQQGTIIAPRRHTERRAGWWDKHCCRTLFRYMNSNNTYQYIHLYSNTVSFTGENFSSQFLIHLFAANQESQWS